MTIIGAERDIHLSVPAIERLAKAGVRIKIGGPNGIIPVEVMMDATDDHRENDVDRLAEPWRFNNLARAVWERWLRSKRVVHDPNSSFGNFDTMGTVPFVLLATQHDLKVVLSVHPTNSNYLPFQLEDDAAIFPSDALMAKLALWEKSHG